MPRVVVNTQNYMFADMIKRTLESGDFSVTIVDKPEKLLPEFNRTAANIVLMEVTGYICAAAFHSSRASAVACPPAVP